MLTTEPGTWWVSEWKSLNRVQLLEIPWTVAFQAPLSMEFSRQEYWSELPLQRIFLTQGIEPGSPALQANSLLSESARQPPGTWYWHSIDDFHCGMSQTNHGLKLRCLGDLVGYYTCVKQGAVGGIDLKSLSPLWDSNVNLKNHTSNRDFPGGPVVKNPPSNAGDTGSIAGRGTKIPPAVRGWRLCNHNCWGHGPHPERKLGAAAKTPHSQKQTSK